MSKGITLFCRLKQLYKMVSLSAAGTVVLLTSPFFLMLSNISLNGNIRIQHYSLRLADSEVSVLLYDLVKALSFFLNCYSVLDSSYLHTVASIKYIKIHVSEKSGFGSF